MVIADTKFRSHVEACICCAPDSWELISGSKGSSLLYGEERSKDHGDLHLQEALQEGRHSSRVDDFSLQHKFPQNRDIHAGEEQAPCCKLIKRHSSSPHVHLQKEQMFFCTFPCKHRTVAMIFWTQRLLNLQIFYL